MNWEKLKVFKKVAKAGSFLTASKQDNKSQSTFSRAVMDLEKEINQKLFNRTSKGVIPTLHGNTLLVSESLNGHFILKKIFVTP